MPLLRFVISHKYLRRAACRCRSCALSCRRNVRSYDPVQTWALPRSPFISIAFLYIRMRTLRQVDPFLRPTADASHGRAMCVNNTAQSTLLIGGGAELEVSARRAVWWGGRILNAEGRHCFQNHF